MLDDLGMSLWLENNPDVTGQEARDEAAYRLRLYLACGHLFFDAHTGEVIESDRVTTKDTGD